MASSIRIRRFGWMVGAVEKMTIYVIQIVNTQRDRRIGRVFTKRQSAELECKTLMGQHPTWNVFFAIRTLIDD